MRAPWSWIKEFAPVTAPVQEVADRLSMRALKVERVEQTGGDISGVIVGSVLKMEEHPDADKLMLVSVDTGSDVREIVCGARNYAPGDRVPVALPGATLPGGMEIAERSVRGKVSHGMMCSARELGLSDDHSGILILPSDAPLGADARTVLGLDDAVLDLDVTSNRPDALSIAGVAREIAVMEGVPFAIPEISLVATGPEVGSLAAVAVKDAKGCPRYLARVVTGLTNQASPQWMKQRLLAAGMRPISAIVDITNYVLLERGQPLHAFDLDKLDGAQIVVRKPKKGETITTLDGVARNLDASDVVICDAKRPVAVAGVMGGADSEVSEATTSVLLESAYFEPGRIRATARRMGLRTEASVRFERGADIEAAASAADRACELLVEICGGTVAQGALDVCAKRPKAKPIRLRVARANELMGVVVAADDMASMLRALGMDVAPSGRTALRVIPPSFRPDIEIEEDLIEEIARLHGYENIPETLPRGTRTGGLSREQALRLLVRRMCLGSGLSEAQTLSLLPPSLPDRFGLGADHPWRKVLVLDNPLSEEESVLRPAVLPGLLLATERNIARRVSTVALFEIGTVFIPSDEQLPHEEQRVAWVLAGRTLDGWHGERGFDLYDAKGILEAILNGLNVAGVTMEPAAQPHLHPGRSAKVLIAGVEVGWFGELHPRIARELDVAGRCAVGEIALAPLLAAVAEPGSFDVPKFPAVERDVAVVVSEGESAETVKAVVREAAGALLESVELFDVYRGGQTGEGKVSLAFRLAFRAPERTLTDSDASAALEAVLTAVQGRGWHTRT